MLGGPPYNFNPAAVGSSKFAFAVGGITGLLIAGPFSDLVAMKATARNGGIREAEMRLAALIPYCLTTVIGIVIGGLEYQRKLDWPIILVIGYCFSGLCVAAGSWSRLLMPWTATNQYPGDYDCRDCDQRHMQVRHELLGFFTGGA